MRKNVNVVAGLNSGRDHRNIASIYCRRKPCAELVVAAPYTALSLLTGDCGETKRLLDGVLPRNYAPG